MGWRGKLTGSNVHIKVDGLAELEVHVDALEAKVDDMITLVKVLSDELAELKKAEKKPVKKAAAKKAVK